jgi:hypothetical protein
VSLVCVFVTLIALSNQQKEGLNRGRKEESLKNTLISSFRT